MLTDKIRAIVKEDNTIRYETRKALLEACDKLEEELNGNYKRLETPSA